MIGVSVDGSVGSSRDPVMRLAQSLVGWFQRHEPGAELLFVRYLTETLGPQWAVRYFRNPNPKVTVALLRELGAQVGEGTTIKGSLFFDNIVGDANSTGDFSHLKIGSNCYIGDGVLFDLADEIVLGDNVVVSAQASFVTHADCNRSPYLAQHYPRICKRVEVRDGAWIGLRGVVLCGVTIGDNSVLAANSVAREHTQPHALYAGSPAKMVRDLGAAPRTHINKG